MTRLRPIRTASAGSWTSCYLQWGTCEVWLAPEEQPPFAVAARVLEDDTFLVLGADPEFRESREHPIRVHTAALEARPARPGSVVALGGRPLELRAVVHDLGREPTWRLAWVGEALVEVLHQAERRRLTALELPVLGGRYGTVDLDSFLGLLADALEAVQPRALRRIWLHQPPAGGG